MAKEIERKFLLKNDSYKDMSTSCHIISQGYLSRKPQGVVRVRTLDDAGFLTVKSANTGNTRNEWEYRIPFDDADMMLQCFCGNNIIKKTRYKVPFEGHIWEVDEFTLPHTLTVAEIELKSEDEEFAVPPFIGKEVSGDPAYYNSNLLPADD